MSLIQGYLPTKSQFLVIGMVCTLIAIAVTISIGIYTAEGTSHLLSSGESLAEKANSRHDEEIEARTVQGDGSEKGTTVANADDYNGEHDDVHVKVKRVVKEDDGSGARLIVSEKCGSASDSGSESVVVEAVSYYLKDASNDRELRDYGGEIGNSEQRDMTKARVGEISVPTAYNEENALPIYGSQCLSRQEDEMTASHEQSSDENSIMNTEGMMTAIHEQLSDENSNTNTKNVANASDEQLSNENSNMNAIHEQLSDENSNMNAFEWVDPASDILPDGLCFSASSEGPAEQFNLSFMGLLKKYARMLISETKKLISTIKRFYSSKRRSFFQY